MVIVLCCTKNWYIHLATVIYAILKQNKVKKIYLFIEDDNIPYLDTSSFATSHTDTVSIPVFSKLSIICSVQFNGLFVLYN